VLVSWQVGEAGGGVQVIEGGFGIHVF
jgi:hypothetical protein